MAASWPDGEKLDDIVRVVVWLRLRRWRRKAGGSCNTAASQLIYTDKRLKHPFLCHNHNPDALLGPQRQEKAAHHMVRGPLVDANGLEPLTSCV